MNDQMRFMMTIQNLWFEVFVRNEVSWLDWEKPNTFKYKEKTKSRRRVNDWDLINHYGMFVAYLETLFIKSCKKLYPLILDSKEIIQPVPKKENIVLFSNVNITIHRICIACRNLLSRHEEHIVKKQHSLNEVIIIIAISYWWNSRKSNEPVLEDWKQWR